jgi:hypothetical protein
VLALSRRATGERRVIRYRDWVDVKGKGLSLTLE